MKVNIYCSGVFVLMCLVVVFGGCGKEEKHEQTNFTKTDSLTETYLAVQENLIQAWNTMVHDENRKIKAMQTLIAELSDSNPDENESINTLEARLSHLIASRYDQNSMSDPESVAEYDFTSNTLITELISLAESEKEFATNATMQRLVDEIRLADQRVNNYREEYDIVAAKYNRFIEDNRELLKEFDEDSLLQTKPLFEMTAE